MYPPHPEYLNLGRDSDKRRKKYRELFKHHFSDTVLEQIRKATNKGMIVGNDRFREEIEALTGRLGGGSQRFNSTLTPIILDSMVATCLRA
jgi:hypothetical protein